MQTDDVVAGRYRLERRLGSGGGGIVWRAVDLQLDRVVALKHAMTGDDARARERMARLRREGRILARMNHPNVVTLFDVVPHDDKWWLVMEYVPAPNLAEHQDPALDPVTVARIGVQLADALRAVHAAGVVHRDIKPHNVFLTQDHRAKLGDFGISRVVHAEATVTGVELVMGTPGYLAPEVAEGGDPTPASDVFSLGATLFTAVEGVPPFGAAQNPLVLIRRAARGEIATAEHAGPLAPVLAALLQTDPARRPTAAETGHMLADVANRVGRVDEPNLANTADSVAGPPPGDPPPGDPPPGTRRFARRSVALVGAAVIALAGLGFWSASAGWWEPGEAGRTSDTTAGGEPQQPAPLRHDRQRTARPLGNPRTADPCALISSASLDRFGDADLDANYGGFNRCDVIVSDAASEVDVRVEFGEPDGDLDLRGTRVERTGSLRVAREPVDDGECERTVLLPDEHVVYVTAAQYGDGPASLCPMADTVTDHAVDVLSRGTVQRRAPAAASSLLRVDACGLLDNATLAGFPGIDAAEPEVGFGGWDCRWFSTTNPLSLRLLFNQDLPMSAEDGQPTRLGTHRAFVVPEGYGAGGCQVSVPHREYVDIDDVRMVEYLLVIVEGEEPMRRLCRRAVEFAEPAAANLP